MDEFEIKFGPWELKKLSNDPSSPHLDSWRMRLTGPTEGKTKELIVSGVELLALVRITKTLALLDIGYFVSPHETQV